MRTLSAAFQELMQKSEMGSAVLVTFVQVTHPLITTRFICDDNQNQTVSGQVYTPEAFQIQLPEDSLQTIPTGVFMVQALDGTWERDFSIAMASDQDLTLTVFMLLHTQLGTKELGPATFNIRAYDTDEENLTAILTLDLPLDEPFPGICFDRKNNPGLFAET